MASSSSAAASFNYNNFLRTIDPSRPDPSPVIQDFLDNATTSKLSDLMKSLESSSWKSVSGEQLISLVTSIRQLNSSKRKEVIDENTLERSKRIDYLVRLIFYNMTSVQAIQAFSSMDPDECLKFLEELPYPSRVWVILSEFSKMDDSMQEKTIGTVQRTIDRLGTDVFFHERIYPADEEVNPHLTFATNLWKLANKYPKFAFLKVRLLDLITSKSEDQTLLFPLYPLAVHLDQVSEDKSYRQEAINRVEKHLLIVDEMSRLTYLSQHLHLDPLALHSELVFFAKHLYAMNFLDPKFGPYINVAIRKVKEALCNNQDDEFCSRLVPLFLQYVTLENERGVLSNDYNSSFWLNASAEYINPLIDYWFKYLPPQNLALVTDSLLVTITLENLNTEIRTHLMAKLNLE